LLPSDWLQIIDSDHVKLPDFHTHNGTTAKERALANKRQQKHRAKLVTQQRDSHKRDTSVTVLPDQTRPESGKRAGGSALRAAAASPKEKKPPECRHGLNPTTCVYCRDEAKAGVHP
jgi:hypothetical protein